MQTSPDALVDPWRLDVIVVRGRSYTDGERAALRRDEARGLLRRIGHGAYVERTAFDALGPEDQHVVRMRAHADVAGDAVVFSHWSAAVLHGLSVSWERLTKLHVTVPDPALRSGSGTVGHVFALDDREVVTFRGIRATGVGRTVVDVAGSSPFEEGVVVADAALRAGVPRRMLEAAVDLAGPRRAGRRIGDAVAFAHPGAESAAESRFRVSLMRLGYEVPVLQFRIRLAGGSDVFLDAYLPESQAGVEVDGDRKYLDPAMASEGTGRALIAEKRREDEVRTRVRALARIGWVQAGSTVQLRSVLGRIGVSAPRPRCTIADFAAAALHAQPRHGMRAPRWRA